MKNRFGIIWLTVAAALGLLSIAAYDPGMNHAAYGAYSTANQALTSQATPQNSTNLVATVAANKAYYVRATLPFALAGIASGYKFAVTGPASPSVVRLTGVVNNGVTIAVAGIATVTALGTVTGGALAAIGDHYAEIEGTFVNGSTAGTLQVQFSQNVSDSSAVTLYKGASLIVIPLN
jgi:hypothetical protein